MQSNGVVWLPGLPIFLKVWMFAPLWFLSELLNAINEQKVHSTAGGVAYLVHVGGFLFGLVAATIFTTTARLVKSQGQRIVLANTNGLAMDKGIRWPKGPGKHSPGFSRVTPKKRVSPEGTK